MFLSRAYLIFKKLKVPRFIQGKRDFKYEYGYLHVTKVQGKVLYYTHMIKNMSIKINNIKYMDNNLNSL